MTKKQDKSNFNISLSVVRQNRRFNTFMAFTTESESKVIQSYNYFRYLNKSGVKCGCDCGCGGDNINEDMYDIGANLYYTINC